MIWKPTRFIFVNRFYWPDEPATAQLLADLAIALAARHHEVYVIASQSNVSLPLTETRDGVKIVRVKSTHWGKTNLAKRLIDTVTFFWNLPKAFATVVRPGDRVVSLTDPPLLDVVVQLLAYLYEAKCVHWVHDIFPEVAMVMTRNPLFRLAGFVLRPLRNRAWRKSTACITLGHDMAALIGKAGGPTKRVAIVPNWAPAGLRPQPREAASELRRLWELTGKFVVAYSGNLGRVHDLKPIIEVAAAVASEPEIIFVFIGRGAGRRELETAVKARGLSNVRFHSPQARDHLNETLALGDVHLVTLREECRDLVFPSKIYGIAAVGRPIVFIGPPASDPAQLVVDDGFGVAFARTEIAKIATTLQELRRQPERCAQLGAAAAQASAKYGGVAAAVAAWETVLECKPLASELLDGHNSRTG
jgi:glycosyltransferase involved in cell wall biosynthesis